MTQAELAARARVSRQLVAAVEAGRNAPAVDAALRIADALDATVEALFAPRRDAPAVSAFGGRLESGVPLRAGRVGEHLVAAPLGDHGAAGTGWAAPDAIVEGGRLVALPDADLDGLVLAGCDPALGIAEAMLRGRGAASLVVFAAATDTALRALASARVHAAVVHGPGDALPVAPVPVLRLRLAAWRVGLGVPDPGLPGSLEEVLSGSASIVRRGDAAASQQAVERAAGALGIGIAFGPRASGHIDAARLATVLRCPAVTTEAAARAFGLGFVPVEAHAVEVWIAAAWAGHAGVEALGNLLRSAAFTARLATFGGYELAGCGTYVADA